MVWMSGPDGSVEPVLDSFEQRLDLRYQAIEARLVAAIRSDLQAALTAQARLVVTMFVAAVLPLLTLVVIASRPN